MLRCTTAFVVAVVGLSTGTVVAQDTDDYAHARAMEVEGQRPEAIAMLRRLETASPQDGDVVRLLGTVLSWEGQYDEARTFLERGLALHPRDLDTLSALMNVELWSDDPQRSLELAQRGVGQAPNDDRFLQGRERAQRAIDRARPWEVSLVGYYDQFSDGRDAWHEQQLAVKRETPIGSVIVRASHATRFDLHDEMFEAEMYPRFRSGTYADVSVGFAPNNSLYPDFRFAGEIYQSLGAGFEASVGYRRLVFEVPTDIYVASLTKYVGNWMLTGRVMVVPTDTGTSDSYHGIFRRYFGADGRSYVGARISHGFARTEDVRDVNDLTIGDSNTIGLETELRIFRRLFVSGGWIWTRQEHPTLETLDQHTLSATVGYRF